jgi:glycosyltransferase involved in cell wall biosynthesis
LQKHVGDVIPLGPAEPGFITFLCKVIHGISLLLFKKRFDYRHSTIYSKACARIFQKKLAKHQYDIVVTPACVNVIAYLKEKKPIVIVADRTISGALGYHEILSGLWKWSERQSVKTDRLAMQKAAAMIFSSQWAAGFALKEYKLDQQKVHVIPFGANMDAHLTAEQVLVPKEMSVIKLLLVGTYWRNKGADIAVDALDQLIKKGVKAQLTVVGCTPDHEIKNENVTVIPFINKNTPEGAKKLEELFLSHHFFLLPTRFDCTPIVFCEASYYGLPILSARTGGVEGHIKEGKNGFLIDYNDRGEAYAEKIEEIVAQSGAYETLRRSTRQMYDELLNWDHWGIETKAVMEELRST